MRLNPDMFEAYLESERKSTYLESVSYRERAWKESSLRGPETDYRRSLLC